MLAWVIDHLVGMGDTKIFYLIRYLILSGKVSIPYDTIPIPIKTCQNEGFFVEMKGIWTKLAQKCFRWPDQK